MSEQRRAIVVGAGIGGLAAAIGLRRVGWDVVVHEQTVAPRPVGAGISLWSNARRALAWLGVDDAVGAHGVTRPGGGVRTSSGRWLSDSVGGNLLTSEEVSLVMVHRADLHAALLAALPAEVVRFDSAVEKIEESATEVTVRLVAPNASRTATADVLVAADGVWSGCRSQLWPSAFRPRYAGFTAWRGVTDGSFPLATQSQTMGPAAEFGLVQLLDGRVYWFATGNDPEGARTSDERDEVLARFGSWHSPIRAVIEATSPAAVLRHDIYRLTRPYPSFVCDRVVLLGDAAHAMLPNLGQGGCLALEDAVTLAHALDSSADVPSGLRAYDAARRPRTQTVAAMSDQTAKLAQLRHPLLTTLRAAAIRATPASVVIKTLRRATDWHPPS